MWPNALHTVELDVGRDAPSHRVARSTHGMTAFVTDVSYQTFVRDAAGTNPRISTPVTIRLQRRRDLWSSLAPARTQRD
jgi:hypothetical protein